MSWHFISPVASSIPYDDTICQLGTDSVQGAIEALCVKVSTSASPGFTWGDSGNLVSGKWLMNDTVPSNLTGRRIYLFNGTLDVVFADAENSATYTIAIYEHDGTTFTFLADVVVTAARGNENVLVTPPSLTQGQALAAQMTSGAARNIVCGALLSGTTTP